MTKFSQKDLLFSVMTGLITGFVAWRILIFLGKPELWGMSVIWLIIIIPVLWVVGVNLGYFLGRWMSFFDQFGKFVAIGFTNAAVDFGVLNLLIATTGIATGVMYTVFKAISFVSAVIPSFFWNKYWAFSGKSSSSTGSGSPSEGGFEFAKFMSVAVISIFINTGVASLVVNYMHPLAGLSVQVWANVGAVVGSATALVFNFAGFKFLVFKK